jgi:hypothetical protein
VNRAPERLVLTVTGPVGLPGAVERLGTLRERVVLYDGRLDVDETTTEGFAVDCRLALQATAMA